MDDRQPPYEADADPAAQAFARLEGEMALMRRAVEHLAAEKAAIVIPDYNKTLGEMTKRMGAVAQGLNSLAGQPAMRLTPEGLGERIEAAAQAARRADAAALTEARNGFDQGSHAMREIAGTAYTARAQRRRLIWAAGGGLLAGILLWSFLPGAIARALPDRWHWPERIATRMLDAPSAWDAGMQLMEVGNPQAWAAIVRATETLRYNREEIDRCRRTR